MEDVRSKTVNFSAAGVLVLGILAYPVAWILGLGVVVPPLVALIAGVTAIAAKRRRTTVPTGLLLLLLFLASYAASMLLAVLQQPDVRLVSSVYNFSIWAAGALIVLALHSANHTAAPDSARTRDSGWLETRIARAFVLVGALTGLAGVGLIALWLSGIRSIEATSFVGSILPTAITERLPTLVVQHLELPLVGTNWFFGSVALPRLSILHPYPTALALSSALSVAMYFFLRMSGRKRRGVLRKSGWNLLLLILLVPLIFSLSRVTILVCFAIGALLVFRTSFRKLLPQVAVGSTFVVLALLTLLVEPGLAVKVGNAVGDARAGSTLGRAVLYMTTLEYSAEKPLMGYGFKPDSVGLGLPAQVPIGSHSTPLGALLKTGVIGFLPLATFLVVIGLRSLKRMRQITDPSSWIHAGVLLIVCWSLLEDLDAAPFVSYQAFLVIGLSLRTMLDLRSTGPKVEH